DGTHSGIEVDANDLPGWADTLCGNAPHESGAAGHVQHALAHLKARGVDQQRRPRAEHVSGGVALVEFGGLRRNLPWLVLHRPLHPSLCDIRCAVCVTALICSRGGDAGICWMEPPMPTAPA